MPTSPPGLSFPAVPRASSPASPPSVAAHRLHLPVPSPFGPRWRPPCSLRPGVLRSRGCPLKRAAARVWGGLNLYVERVDDRRLEVVALAVEAGGRWRDEASLVPKRARLRTSLQSVLVARWSALLAHAAMSAFAVSLAGVPVGAQHCNLDGSLPPLGELLDSSARSVSVGCNSSAPKLQGASSAQNCVKPQ